MTNLACLDCAGPLDPDGKCHACSDEPIAGPDPYEVAAGLDLATLERDRQHALARARDAADAFADAAAEREAAVRAAVETGASLREVAAFTGVSHATIKRILRRTQAAA